MLPKLLVTLLFVLSFLAILIECSNNQRLLNGNNANQQQFPHQVSLRRKGFHICSGTILSTQYVLTAAQCVVQSFSGGINRYNNYNLLFYKNYNN